MPRVAQLAPGSVSSLVASGDSFEMSTPTCCSSSRSKQGCTLPVSPPIWRSVISARPIQLVLTNRSARYEPGAATLPLSKRLTSTFTPSGCCRNRSLNWTSATCMLPAVVAAIAPVETNIDSASTQHGRGRQGMDSGKEEVRWFTMAAETWARLRPALAGMDGLALGRTWRATRDSLDGGVGQASFRGGRASQGRVAIDRSAVVVQRGVVHAGAGRLERVARERERVRLSPGPIMPLSSAVALRAPDCSVMPITDT